MSDQSGAELTVADLKSECKAAGIKASIKTYSFGPAVSFEVDGVGGDVFTKEFYDDHELQFEALKAIKAKYLGVKHNGLKLIGLKP